MTAIHDRNHVKGVFHAARFWGLTVGLAVTPFALTAHAEPKNGADGAIKREPPAIYDTKADGQEQIKEALEVAKKENKRVLLKFGANWCVWCRQLHRLFEQDQRVAGKLKDGFVLVFIDVDTVDGKKHNEEVDRKYGNPTKNGLPVLVVLDAEGQILVTQSTEPFEVEDHHDPEKVLAFLSRWTPPTKSAKTP